MRQGPGEVASDIINWWRTAVTADRALQYHFVLNAVTRGSDNWQPIVIKLIELDATVSTEFPQLLSDFRLAFPQLSPVWTVSGQQEVIQS